MDTYEAQFATLQVMFEDVDAATIKKVLLEEKGDVERSIDSLLNLAVLETSTATSTPDDDAVMARLAFQGTPRVENSDEALARMLQEQFNTEDDDEKLARKLQSEESYSARTYYPPAHVAGTYPSNYQSNYNMTSSYPTSYSIAGRNDDSENEGEIDLGSLLSNTENITEFKTAIKENILPMLSQQLKEVEIPEINETVDAGAKLGTIAFGVNKLKVASVEIPEDTINIEFDASAHEIKLNITNISLSLENVEWFYKKEKFPKLKDKGRATAGISNTSIKVIIGITLAESAPSVKVTTCEVKVGKLKISVSGTKVSVLYNLMIKSLKRLIRTQLEKALTEMLRGTLEEQALELLNS